MFISLAFKNVGKSRKKIYVIYIYKKICKYVMEKFGILKKLKALDLAIKRVLSNRICLKLLKYLGS